MTKTANSKATIQRATLRQMRWRAHASCSSTPTFCRPFSRAPPSRLLDGQLSLIFYQSLIFYHCLVFFTVLCAPFQATRRPIVSYFLPLSLIFYHCLVFFTVLCVPMYFLFCVYPCLFFFCWRGGMAGTAMVFDNVLSTLHAAHSSSMCSKDICVVKTYV